MDYYFVFAVSVRFFFLIGVVFRVSIDCTIHFFPRSYNKVGQSDSSRCDSVTFLLFVAASYYSTTLFVSVSTITIVDPVIDMYEIKILFILKFILHCVLLYTRSFCNKLQSEQQAILICNNTFQPLPTSTNPKIFYLF